MCVGKGDNTSINDALVELFNELSDGMNFEKSLTDISEYYKLEPSTLRQAYQESLRRSERERIKNVITETCETVRAISESFRKLGIR